MSCACVRVCVAQSIVDVHFCRWCGNTCVGESACHKPLTSTNFLAIIKFKVDDHFCNIIYQNTIWWSYTLVYNLAGLSLLQMQVHFTYHMLWMTLYYSITTCNLHLRYHSKLGSIIAEQNSLEMIIDLNLIVIEMIIRNSYFAMCNLQ